MPRKYNLLFKPVTQREFRLVSKTYGLSKEWRAVEKACQKKLVPNSKIADLPEFQRWYYKFMDRSKSGGGSASSIFGSIGKTISGFAKKIKPGLSKVWNTVKEDFKSRPSRKPPLINLPIGRPSADVSDDEFFDAPAPSLQEVQRMGMPLSLAERAHLLQPHVIPLPKPPVGGLNLLDINPSNILTPSIADVTGRIDKYIDKNVPWGMKSIAKYGAKKLKEQVIGKGKAPRKRSKKGGMALPPGKAVPTFYKKTPRGILKDDLVTVYGSGKKRHTRIMKHC